VEQVTAVSRVDVEKDARNDDGLELEKLLEEDEAVVQRLWQLLEVEPDVKRARRREVDVKAEFMESGKDMISFGFEVPLESDLLNRDSGRVQQRDGGQL